MRIGRRTGTDRGRIEATLGLVLLSACLAVVLASCASDGGVASPASPASAASGAPAAPTTTAAPGESAQVASTAGPEDGVTEDPSLLRVLPDSVAGTAVALEEQSFTDAAADPSFARNIEAAAFAVAAGANDLASGVVARPRPGRYSDAWFRDWRETYDEGACAQAGGVTGSAQADLGGRTVYITTCDGGLRVYHAWLEERGLLVSLFSVGDGRYGEQLMSGLRP